MHQCAKRHDWNNTTVLRGDVVNEVSTLKQQLDGDIVVAASFQLVHTLLGHDLVGSKTVAGDLA